MALVRYYKNDAVITSMSVLTIPIPYYTHSINTPLLFLISDQGDLELYPYNIDPRTIVTPHNGAKTQVPGLSSIIHLHQDLYLLFTSSSLTQSRLQLQPPRLQCLLPHSPGHLHYQLSLSVPVPSCVPFSPSPSSSSPSAPPLPPKTSFHQSCTLTLTTNLLLSDPELSRLQKWVLYGVVGAVVLGFGLGLGCLVRWRDGQLGLIGRIGQEILRFRDRQRKLRPFVEEEHKGGVEF